MLTSHKNSERERLLKLIDGESAPEPPSEGRLITAAMAKASMQTATPQAAPAPQVNFQMTHLPKQILWIIPACICGALIASAAITFLKMNAKHPVPAATTPAFVVHPSDKADSVRPLGLKLVGVDWSNDPVALIEDTRTGKTYFAKKNDAVNDARIKLVLKDRVVLQIHRETVELKA